MIGKQMNTKRAGQGESGAPAAARAKRSKAPATDTPDEAPASSVAPKTKEIQIKPPNLRIVEFELRGTSPLVVNRFANKGAIMQAQSEGSKGKKGKAREAKDFDACFQAARHRSIEGWDGVHAGGFRSALISACRLVGFKMTLAKLSLFVLQDGVNQDGLPIVRVHTPGNKPPKMVTHHVRNDSGVIDIRARPMFEDWSINLRVRYDADQFSDEEVANLLLRVGMQVGIGEGRADSKDSAGMGWGFFDIVTEEGHDRAAAE